MQAGLHALRRRADPVPRRPTSRCPTPWTDEAGRRVPDPARRRRIDALALARLYAPATPAAGPAPRGDPDPRLGAPGHATGACRARASRRSCASPTSRRSSRSADGGKDGTALDGFVQIGVAKEDQPHYLKVLGATRRRRCHRSSSSGSAIIAARTARSRSSPRPRGHRARADLRVADRSAARGGGLRVRSPPSRC